MFHHFGPCEPDTKHHFHKAQSAGSACEPAAENPGGFKANCRVPAPTLCNPAHVDLSGEAQEPGPRQAPQVFLT